MISKVLTEFKADTSDMKAKLKELQGIEKERAQQQLKDATSVNASYDGYIDKLGKVGLAIDTVGKFVGAAQAGFKAYAENLRLTTAAGKVDIDRLALAAQGLRTQHELLTFAAQSQSAMVKLNQEQLETAQKAMVALTRAGFDQEEVTKKVTDAIIKLNVGGLDDFGIKVDKGNNDVATFNNLMAELGKRANGVDQGMGTAAEGVQRVGVTMNDAMDKMKQALGALVVAMAPLLDALARAVGLIADIAIGSTQEVNWIDGANKALGTNAISRDKDLNINSMLGLNKATASPTGGIDPLAALGSIWGSGPGDAWGNEQLGGKVGAFLENAKKDYDDWKKKNKLSDKELEELAIAEARRALAPYYAAAELRERAALDKASAQASGYGDWRISSRDDGWMADVYGFDLEAQQKKLDAAGRDESSRGGRYDKFNAGQSQSKLAEMFGPLEDFNAYATAFGMLTGSVTSAMDAWITGSMSAGQAVKKFLADALKGLASQMAVEALKHGAYAIGSLAFGDFRGAGQHAAAAAAFGGAAAAAAVASKSLGGGGANASAGAGGGSAGANGGVSTSGSSSGGNVGKSEGSDSKRPIFVLVGDSFSQDSPRMRQTRAQEAVDKALRERDE